MAKYRIIDKGNTIYVQPKKEAVSFAKQIYVTLEQHDNGRWIVYYIGYSGDRTGHYEGYKNGNVPDFPKAVAIKKAISYLKKKKVI